MAIGCMASSLLLAFTKQRNHKLFPMYLGSYICLAGITFFGMGRNIRQWCIVALIGCSGMPVYQTYQTVILREKVPVTMQGFCATGSDYRDSDSFEEET